MLNKHIEGPSTNQSRGTHTHTMFVYCMWQESGVLNHPAFLGSLHWSSMTFKITPVCRLKHSGTNDSDKGMPSRWMACSCSHPERERQTEAGRRSGRNIDGEIEREGDATLSRLILKFCTQEPAVNHAKTHRGKKPSSVLFTRGGTIWMDGAPYRRPAGVWGRKRTRTAKEGRHISFLEGEKVGDECWVGLAELGKPIQCGGQVLESTLQAKVLPDTLSFLPSNLTKMVFFINLLILFQSIDYLFRYKIWKTVNKIKTAEPRLLCWNSLFCAEILHL